MSEIYRRAKDECKYNATRFLEMISTIGGVETARRLLHSEFIQYGFDALWESGRLDLTVEAHVITDEFRDLFTDEERQIARKRLEDYGYQFPDETRRGP
ncbi:MAG TPA: hypothetical protein VFT91_04290 [Dehalococcoidia bacterium]|nr:hypothetical protein [Dehalococcoidia bacterium]